ncbi:MAG: NAD(P)H-dependent oxidoreductase subunit E [Planctomycetota bacterium]|nr:NAD(P)H-dependent oxidoreductase subunit E [Planctomycetota bacterium]MCX8039592.1 NAD(P)H-dependent oxidoreductase subunit E [Planctomycetota bacterium]MDW8373117.1 NAD(P)H-dependent oxidoreductase subunit E [Planctomycetota bacterium]
MSTCCAPPSTAARRFARVTEILARHRHDPAALVPILQEVQEVYRYLPEEVMAYIATDLGLPPARVFGVATFYAHFALAPKGRFVIKLCDGTACHVKESQPILDALRQRLGLSERKTTTDDQLFTVETVSCLGACGLAPVMLVNDDVHGQMTPQSALQLVESLIAKHAKETP